MVDNPSLIGQVFSWVGGARTMPGMVGTASAKDPSNLVIATVDDDRRVRDSVENVLESAGYEAVTWMTG